MINVVNECCGCTACANICPKNCIEMKSNVEGFIYPKIDIDRCVNCGACEKVCPVIERKIRINEYSLKGYIFQNKDKLTLQQSTSGGVLLPYLYTL